MKLALKQKESANFISYGRMLNNCWLLINILFLFSTLRWHHIPFPFIRNIIKIEELQLSLRTTIPDQKYKKQIKKKKHKSFYLPH